MIAGCALGAVSYASSGATIPRAEVPNSVWNAIERFGLSVFLVVTATVMAVKMFPTWKRRALSQAKAAEEACREIKEFRREQRSFRSALGRLEVALARIEAKTDDDDHEPKGC